jgi:hypothetical protein
MISSLSLTNFEIFVTASLLAGPVLNPLIKQFITNLQKPLVKDEEKISSSQHTHAEFKNLPALLGVLERVTYVGALVAGVPDFIGLWLGLKTAGGLMPTWNVEEHKHLGHARFMVFEIGNLISLGAAVGSYYLFATIFR